MKQKLAIFGLLLAMLLPLSILESKAQEPTFPEEHSECKEGYKYGGWILVDRILCADVYIEFCYKNEEGFESIFDIEITNTYFDIKSTDCTISEVQEIFDIGYWDLYEDYLVHLLDHIRNLEDMPLNLPGNTNYYLVTLSLASCSSKELTPVNIQSYRVWNEEQMMWETKDKIYYGYKKCAENIYCESYYSVRWYYNTEKEILDLETRYEYRQIDYYGECPETSRYSLQHQYPPVYYDIKCTVKCDF